MSRQQSEITLVKMLQNDSSWHENVWCWMQTEEVIDKAVKEAISSPWLPLPLGLKPPSTESVLTELSRQGISSIPLHVNGSHPHWRGTRWSQLNQAFKPPWWSVRRSFYKVWQVSWTWLIDWLEPPTPHSNVGQLTRPLLCAWRFSFLIGNVRSHVDTTEKRTLIISIATVKRSDSTAFLVDNLGGPAPATYMHVLPHVVNIGRWWEKGSFLVLLGRTRSVAL